MASIISPLRAWSQQLVLAALLALSVALLTIERISPELAERARGAATDLIAPILDLLSRPSTATAQAIDGIRELAALRQENALLREERDRLLQWQTVARRLDSENQQLRTLLNLAPDPRARFVSARVVGGSGGAFVRSVLVTAGERDGARKNQPAITGEGLLGRVSEVGDRSSRILLLTDINSRVPVVVERTHEQAVLAGNNSNSADLKYLSADTKVAVGDRIVTSGYGGIFPPGLPIGVITKLEKGQAAVQPYVDWERAEYVRLVDYELSNLLLPLMDEELSRGRR
ncbi:MAG: rod shape-determining protein MreC [Dongiaceae bacterium]